MNCLLCEKPFRIGEQLKVIEDAEKTEGGFERGLYEPKLVHKRCWDAALDGLQALFVASKGD